MESFGDLLSRLLTEKHMTVYALAKRTGVERSFIQKMKSGARVPQDRNVAATLARGLSLTMTEQSRFMEAYFRSQMGEDLYHERSLVRDILTGFYTERGASPMVEMSSENRIHLPEHTALIKGRPQVNRMVRAVLEMEASKKDGRILLLTQPSFRFLYDTLSTMDLDANHTEVLNIIRFNKDSSTDHFYNLEVFKSLAPILFVQKNFKPYYVYEYVQAIYNPSSFLPYAILTGDYGMHVSYDTASALVYDRKDIRDLAADSFRKKLTAASPLLTTVNAAPEDYFYTIGPLMDWDSDNLNVMYQPCLIPFCPQSVMEKAINPAVFTPPGSENMFAEISSYFVAMRDYAPRLAQNFTMAGLTDFMETGWVAEIPRFMMKGPLTPAQRLTILSGLIHGVRDGHVPAHLIRTDRLPLPRQIMLTAYSEQNVTLHYYRRDGSIFLMQPKEAGVRDAFRDFLTWLPESHLVYSAEETLSQLVACYKKYTKQFRLPIPLD